MSCWGWHDEQSLGKYSIKEWFWPPPGQLTVPSSIETSMTFPAIKVLSSQPQLQREWINETATKLWGGLDKAPCPPPDQQVLCFDNLFYGLFFH